jgi:hypothetical protein
MVTSGFIIRLSKTFTNNYNTIQFHVARMSRRRWFARQSSAGTAAALARPAGGRAREIARGERPRKNSGCKSHGAKLFQVSGAQEAEAFLAALLSTLAWSGTRVFALMTLRSDFLGSFQSHPALRSAPFAGIPLGMMPLEDFPQVIEGPAARAGVALGRVSPAALLRPHAPCARRDRRAARREDPRQYFGVTWLHSSLVAASAALATHTEEKSEKLKFSNRDHRLSSGLCGFTHL